MAKVLGFNEIELNAGTTPEEFERFITEEFQRAPTFPGIRYNLLKGVRGQRVDQYLMVFEFESIETYQRIVPREGEFAEDYLAFLASEAVKTVLERWKQLAMLTNPAYTDYVILATVG